MAEPGEPARPRYEALDGLRGVAALAVVLFHCGVLGGRPVLPHAYLAVDFFFLLSGFVIAHAYEQKLEAGLGAAAFLRSRAVRLWPAIAAGAALGLGVTVVQFARAGHGLHPSLLAVAFAGALLMIPTALPVFRFTPAFPLNPPAWSLFWELTINALYALAARRLSTRALAIVGAGAAVALAAASVAHKGLGSGPLLSDWSVSFPRVLFSFAAGVLLHRLRDRLHARVPLSALAALLVATFLVPPDGLGIYDAVCVLTLYPAIVAAASNATRASPVWKGLGALSYPLYAAHWPILQMFNGFHGGPVAGAPAPVWLIAAETGAAAAAALAVLKLIDEPIRARLTVALKAKATEVKRAA